MRARLFYRGLEIFLLMSEITLPRISLRINAIKFIIITIFPKICIFEGKNLKSFIFHVFFLYKNRDIWIVVSSSQLVWLCNNKRSYNASKPGALSLQCAGWIEFSILRMNPFDDAITCKLAHLFDIHANMIFYKKISCLQLNSMPGSPKVV